MVFIPPEKTSRVAMLQIEDRIKPFFELAININKSYCNLHSINHILLRSGPIDKPPYWWKVSVLLEMLKTSKYDIVCWTDSDAYVNDTDRDIRTFFSDTENNISMIICPDPEPWTSKFMAALFIVKNVQTSINIFEDWLALYNEDAWQKSSNGKWKYIGGNAWAGLDYEQGAFIEGIMPKYHSVIKILPWYVFHETNCLEPHPNCWSIHIPGSLENLRPKCMDSMKKIANNLDTETKNVVRQSKKKFYTRVFCLAILLTLLILTIIFYLK